MYKVAVLGNFGADDGQTVKTKNLLSALEDKYGVKNVVYLDTNLFKKNPVLFLYRTIKILRLSKNIILSFGINGLTYVVPLIYRLNHFYNKSIHYVAIGGWADQVVKEKVNVKGALMSFSNVFVETEILQNKLIDLGLKNVHILNNFKNIQPLSDIHLKEVSIKPYPLVIFSRIIEEKGIGDAINAVISNNKDQVNFKLDIYGPIGSNYKKEFDKLMRDSPDYISYKGIIDAKQSVEILKNYYFLLFPTKFKTEGIPGTIIDAYMSALPVIASKWEASSEVVIDSKTGFLYEFGNQEELKDILGKISIIGSNYYDMKRNALAFSKRYEKDTVINYLSKFLT